MTRLAAPIALAALAVAFGGCSSHDSGYLYPLCSSGVVEASIDRAGFLELDPGEGAGATVEYAGEGAWRIAATCDTYYTASYCYWELTARPLDGTVDSFAAETLEGPDRLELLAGDPSDSVRLRAYTDYGIDAFTLLTTPGAGLRVEARLDGYCAGPFLYWVDQGDIWSSTTTATELFPAEP